MSIRVVTWNMQGGGPGANKWIADVSRLFLQQDADIICLQECGSVPVSAAPMQASPPNQSYPYALFQWNVGSPKKPFNVYVLWLRTTISGNLAILCQPAFFNQNQPLLISSGTSGLLALGIIFRVGQGGTLSIYTSNTFFANGPNSPALLQQIANIPGQSNWFAVGDFNQDPMDWVWNQDVVPKNSIYCGHAPVSGMLGAGTNFDYAFFGLGQPQQSAVATLMPGVVNQTAPGLAGAVLQPAPGQGVQATQATTPSITSPQNITAVPSKIDQAFASSDHFPILYDLPFDLST